MENNLCIAFTNTVALYNFQPAYHHSTYTYMIQTDGAHRMVSDVEAKGNDFALWLLSAPHDGIYL